VDKEVKNAFLEHLL